MPNALWQKNYPDLKGKHVPTLDYENINWKYYYQCNYERGWGRRRFLPFYEKPRDRVGLKGTYIPFKGTWYSPTFLMWLTK
jgi:hypothetical protein